MKNQVQDYFKSACEAYRLGNVESSFNPAIITLLSQFGCNARDLSGERSRQAGENIDIKIWRGDADVTETEPFAGVEVKKVGGIDARAKGQIKKEAALYGYAILTDNMVWQFWRAGEEKMYSGVQIIDHAEGKLVLKEENVELFISLMQDFLLQDPAQIKSSNKLAEYMAIHAKTIRSVIIGILKENDEGLPLIDERQMRLPLFPELNGLFARIKADLRPYLNTRKFADMYAQTVVYGLFIARYNDAASTSFNRYEAIRRLQEESPLLNRFFEHITNTGTKHPTLDAVIDKLCALYQTCNISSLLDSDERRDTIVHFYEDFLTYYDPALRKALGVFYTPYQVVRYLVSMVDKSLVEDFGIEGGLSNNEHFEISVPSERYENPNKRSKDKYLDTKQISVPRVAILDPACGTGTFHAEIIKYIKATYFSGVREAFYDEYIRKEDGLLSRLIGFEIMMTSYAVAHLNVRRAIEETLGRVPETQLPTSIYLTNTLAAPNMSLERNAQISLFDFSAAISDEAYNADTWKTRRPIKVIIGNPPYLAASTNPFDISAYKTETDGVTKLQEKNPKTLGDDYVKFFRFAEKIIESNREGVLAFVSNSGYIDNPTFRGMRASLLRTFNKIYVVNLHGSAVKQETAPDGSRDENIFDIMQGVALFIGIKTASDSERARVFYSDLWGTRISKFQSLDEASLGFVDVVPDHKSSCFSMSEDTDKELYESGISLVELFPISVSGIESGNDNVAIAANKGELNNRIEMLKHSANEAEIHRLWGNFAHGQTAAKILDDLLSAEGVVAPLSFRPFDQRWTYYSGRSNGWMVRPREKKTIGNLLEKATTEIGKNIGMVFTRGDSTPNDFSMIHISDTLVDNRLTAAQTAGKASVAPLYLYDDVTDTWRPNFAKVIMDKLTAHMNSKPLSIEVFDYVYGILHDPVYRERFNDFLKRDFPRVPIINAPQDPADQNSFHVSEEMFRAYVTAGEKLRKLHLMQTKVPAELSIEPNSAEDLEIGAIKYKDGVLHLNANKRIHGIPEDVWNYRIGGYQVLDKWFKSRKGETMTINDFDHIANVVGLLAETIKVQDELRAMHG